uniref:DM2 domain-containing protein n=1 Tax=viral metagenome TaxID=1070528 RepID=A0A6C0EI64_9ZZZZ
MSHENQSVSVPVPEIQESSVKSILNQLIEESTNMQTSHKLWHNSLKQLSKEMDKEVKKVIKSRPKRKVVQKPQKVTDKMQKFMKKYPPALDEGVELEHNGLYTRQIMMKAVSGYIKSANIQNPENKKQWAKDKVLTPIFGLKDDWYTFMQINGLLSRVVIKDVVEAVAETAPVSA